MPPTAPLGGERLEGVRLSAWSPQRLAAGKNPRSISCNLGLIRLRPREGGILRARNRTKSHIGLCRSHDGENLLIVRRGARGGARPQSRRETNAGCRSSSLRMVPGPGERAGKDDHLESRAGRRSRGSAAKSRRADALRERTGSASQGSLSHGRVKNRAGTARLSWVRRKREGVYLRRSRPKESRLQWKRDGQANRRLKLPR